MIKEQKIEWKKIKSFELKDIFDCGQCFRWNLQEDGSYIGVVKNNVIQIKQDNDKIYIEGVGEDDFQELCSNYFDMNTDYEKIKEKLSRNR